MRGLGGRVRREKVEGGRVRRGEGRDSKESFQRQEMRELRG